MMPSEVTVTVQNQTWYLLPEKAVYWKEQKTLIAADLHLGKAGHFRKSGIAAPAAINRKNIERLEQLIHATNPETLLILGDLFHSDANREWLEFEEWLSGMIGLRTELVSGNHDTLHASFYDSAGIRVHETLQREGFFFVHEPGAVKPKREASITVAGHIHPGVSIRGKGRQSLRFPCFLFSEERILLPAFGEFTGLFTIKPEEHEDVYAVVEGSVVELRG